MQEPGLGRFLEEIDAPERSLAVVNRTAPEPLQRLIERLFARQAVDVGEEQLPEEENAVLLLENDEVLASSSLSKLRDAILTVNSDIYMTGTRDLDRIEVPDVLAGLDDVPFRLRGYPESGIEKMLLITVSRFIERTAWEADAGKLRSSFQRLSRARDERGTRDVYNRLGSSGVDTHVYGIPDWTPGPEFGLTIHGGYGPNFQNSWFVVFDPPAGSDHEPIALLAIEDGPNVWEGFWTHRAELIERIVRYVEREL